MKQPKIEAMCTGTLEHPLPAHVLGTRPAQCADCARKVALREQAERSREPRT